MAIDYTKPRKPTPAAESTESPTPTAPAAPPAGPGGIDFSRPDRRGTAAPSAPAAAPAGPAAAPAPAASAAPPISLSKVTLTTSAPTVSLNKGGQRQGVMRVNLNWASRAPGKGFLAKLAGSDQIDLDLGCLYELTDGQKGGVQALGKQFGNLQRAPYILLDGDDRSGASAGGENLLINLEQPHRFKRILIFAMIYQGATKWGEANGVVTLYPTSGPQIEVRLDGEAPGARVCGIALLENRGGELVVSREVRYVTGSQKTLDEAYGWGLNWAPGSK